MVLQETCQSEHLAKNLSSSYEKLDEKLGEELASLNVINEC